MEKLKAILRKIFFLPPLPTALAALFGFGFVISVSALKIRIPAVQYASYICSAYALVVSITGLPYLKLAARKIKAYVLGHPLMKKFRSTAIGERFMTDILFRTEISLGGGLFINLLYIVMKLVSGVYYHSAWFIALAAYYTLLALLRLLLVRRMTVRDRAAELRRCRLCGIILLLMNQALAALVIFIVYQNEGFDYPGLLIYGMALYAFYAVISAMVNIVRSRHYKSPILSAARAISLVAAMVSILSLTTAMLAQFGGNEDSPFRRIMTGAVGGGVCTVVIFLAVYMIVQANRNLKRIPFDDAQTQPPRLHDLVLEVIDNQIRDNEPPAAKETLARLTGAGYSEQEAKEKMAAVLVGYLYDVLRDDAPFDKAGYIHDLLRLS